uniref:Uncharacterized protein n=1 Tax=Romanomermis culicivorax TaxID=13658 RepID=A0A915I744_ROMCU
MNQVSSRQKQNLHNEPCRLDSHTRINNQRAKEKFLAQVRSSFLKCREENLLQLLTAQTQLVASKRVKNVKGYSHVNDSQASDSHHSFVYIFYEDFHTYNDERLKHVELSKNYTGDYSDLK